MQVIDTIEGFRRARRELEGTVAFVPTMGFLHVGHLELMQEGKKRCDHLVVSIFVNPTQFGPNEDLDRYPRDAQGDRKKVEAVGCELLFMPTPEMMYPGGHTTNIQVPALTDVLCGVSRPGHFDGVATVVTKLFNIVQPNVAIFGEKDYQQLAVIERMTRDLNFDIEILGIPIMREPDGLAMSSRNRNLESSERELALGLSRAIFEAREVFLAGEDDAEVLCALVRKRLSRLGGLRIDYVECVRPGSLRPCTGDNRDIGTGRGGVLAVAAFLSKVRLIDNVRLDPAQRV